MPCHDIYESQRVIYSAVRCIEQPTNYKGHAGAVCSSFTPEVHCVFFKGAFSPPSKNPCNKLSACVFTAPPLQVDSPEAFTVVWSQSSLSYNIQRVTREEKFPILPGPHPFLPVPSSSCDFLLPIPSGSFSFHSHVWSAEDLRPMRQPGWVMYSLCLICVIPSYGCVKVYSFRPSK